MSKTLIFNKYDIIYIKKNNNHIVLKLKFDKNTGLKPKRNNKQQFVLTNLLDNMTKDMIHSLIRDCYLCCFKVSFLCDTSSGRYHAYP